MRNYTMLSLVKRYVSTSTWLIFATVLALVCANSPLKEWYFGLWQHEVSLSFGNFNFFVLVCFKALVKIHTVIGLV